MNMMTDKDKSSKLEIFENTSNIFKVTNFYQHQILSNTII